MGKTIAQPTNENENMLLMRIRGLAAQIKRREACYSRGEGSDHKNASTASGLYERVDDLRQRLGGAFSEEVDRILKGLQGITPEANPYSPASHAST